jgi:hypothetical protein
MKWTIAGYYWNGKEHYVIYQNEQGNTKMVFGIKISHFGCYLSNLAWRKLYCGYQSSRKALK